MRPTECERTALLAFGFASRNEVAQKTAEENASYTTEAQPPRPIADTIGRKLPMNLPQHPARPRLAAGLLAIASMLAPATAQDAGELSRPAENPFGRDPAAIQAGDLIFHERCAVCHGQKAQGSMAANLVRTRSVRRGSQAALFTLIRNGIPGTDMPPQPDLPDNGIWQIISYLRSLALPGQQPPLEGDPQAGRVVFQEAGCISCHIVNGTGGFRGPSLDSIAVKKASGKIRTDVLDPDADLAPGFEPIAVETNDGRRVEGVLKNEDTFQVLVLNAEGEVETFERSSLKALTMLTRSIMPADYEARLSPEDLGNLLAFLDRQRDPYTPVVRGFAVY